MPEEVNFINIAMRTSNLADQNLVLQLAKQIYDLEFMNIWNVCYQQIDSKSLKKVFAQCSYQKESKMSKVQYIKVL